MAASRRNGRTPGHQGWSVVTGASSGIGDALARELAERGHDLWLVARRVERLRNLADELSAEYGTAIWVRGCDLADRAERAALSEELRQVRVRVLCANAGFTTCGALADCDPAREAAEVEVDVVATHELTLAVLPGMLARRSGSILMTGSTAGEQPVPTAATYSASKAFVNTFARALHEELRGSGVTCTLLAPGPVRSEFTLIGGVAGIEQHRWWAWMSPQPVARHAVRAMERGNRVAVPGPIAKVQAVAGHYTPHGLVFPMLRALILPRLRSAGVRGRPSDSQHAQRKAS